jgi:putative ABC transport system permease protein
MAGRRPPAPGEVVINEGAAEAGHLRVGDYTTVETPNPVPVPIVGIATFGGAAGVGKETFVAFSLPDAERYIAHRAGEVSQILVRGDPGVNQPTLA